MACNIPIVSTDVGDVRQLIDGIEGCYVSSYHPLDIKNSIETAFSFGRRTEGRKKIENLSLGDIANKIIEIYRAVGHTQSLNLN
jgi:glycosyltransferase involved in cell wall biosynthesis